ncbi:hypothetical protein ASC97_20640 [Rhizobium sp. Root1203]|uniref:hypothetical protein n=1 Tax=Rhizobium sp. Root1203 TaxID=1736427 RepID=UPI00070C6CDD|nr:hypothetical protein [Rhizobium sp. Root1203]KQV30612.1 hypothetical protein ASC97_20640 [Rhizobium sp. Root1203]
MLFGQSVFQSVLDRLKADDENELDAPVSARIRGLTTGLAFDVMEGVSVASAQPGQAYLDLLESDAPCEEEISPGPEPEPAAEPEPVMPEHLSRTAPQDVAAELSISARDTVQSLGEKRRAFAKMNHPDGVDLLFRENAAKRMTIANLLIDEAIKRLGR